MIDSDDTQQPARSSAKVRILNALKRAERAVFTRPPPKSAQAKMKFLRTRAKGSTKALAAGLGVSRSTVERYLSGASKKPQKRLQAALTEATEEQWQPQVRAQARQHAATSGGLVISCRAYFGFTANGTSDEGRVKDIITAVSPTPRRPDPQAEGGRSDGRGPPTGGCRGHHVLLFPGGRHHPEGPASGFHRRRMAEHLVLAARNSELL
ncbi:telomere-protecting terminal protein Tpg [Streptomyces sp. NPDC002092]